MISLITFSVKVLNYDNAKERTYSDYRANIWLVDTLPSNFIRELAVICVTET